jgi:hypothetical protein
MQRGDCSTLATVTNAFCPRSMRPTSTSSARAGAHAITSITSNAPSAACRGRVRSRLPVSLNSALATAGAMGGTAGSPIPVGLSSLSRTVTSMRGVSCMRRLGNVS